MEIAKFLIFSCCVIFLAGCPELKNSVQKPVSVVSCLVTGVSDGDTIKCTEPTKQTITVRLANIDAPEKKQDFGQASKKVLSTLIYNKQVKINIQSQDKYGRYIGEVFHNGQNINKVMVNSGYAWAYTEYLSDKSYVSLENQARQAKLGLWVMPNPLYPSLFRKQERN